MTVALGQQDQEIHSPPVSRAARPDHRRLLAPLGPIAALLVLWEALSRLGLVSSFFFPPPSDIVAALREIGTQGYPDGILVYTHIGATLGRIALGFAGAVSAGVPLGIVIGYVPILDRLAAPIVAFGRSLAIVSLVPLFIAWFGIGEMSKVMLIGIGAFWIVLTFTISAVKSVNPLLIRAARSMDTPAREIFTHVVLPAALPRIFTGFKVALGACFTIIVAAEMIATVQGLGALIMEARNAFRTDIVIAGMLLIGVLGLAAAKLLDLLERKLLPWCAQAEQY